MQIRNALLQHFLSVCIPEKKVPATPRGVGGRRWVKFIQTCPLFWGRVGQIRQGTYCVSACLLCYIVDMPPPIMAACSLCAPTLVNMKYDL